MMMQTLLFPNGGLRSSAALFRPRLAGLRPVRGDILGKEITDIHSHCALQRGESRWFISSIRSDGNGSRRRRLGRNHSSGKTSKEADESKNQPAAGSQDEIIALFKRIQSSLSKDGLPGSTPRRRNAKKIRVGKEIVDLIPEFPRQERAGTGRRGDEEGDVMPSERSELLAGGATNHAASPTAAKAARPASSFVKKSPVSRPSPPKPDKNMDDAADEKQPEAVPAQTRLQPITRDRVLQNLDELKLPELKEVAKEKGIKGYSKMKKGELLQLLKGLSDST